MACRILCGRPLRWFWCVEGLLPLLAPRLWRDSFAKLIAMSDGQLRFIGLASIVVGLVAFWLVRHA